MKATSHKTFTAIALVVLLTSISKSQAQRCSGANALARYHAQVGLELSMPPRGLRGSIQHDDEIGDDYYLFVPEQDLQNPSESESKLTAHRMMLLSCACGGGLAFTVGNGCTRCYANPAPEEDPAPLDLPETTITFPPTPSPTEQGGRLLLEEEHRNNIAAYDPERKGFHVMRKDGAIMRKYGNGLF